MTNEQLLLLTARGRELHAEIEKLPSLFEGKSIGDILTKISPMALMGGNITPESVGLPNDIMDKLKEYARINHVLNQAVVHLLGGNADANQQ